MNIRKEEILKKLKEINKEKYSILKLGLFGSFSKNINTNDSDIDILVKMEDLLKYIYILREKLEKR